jgi:hypothetical protein
VSAAKVAEASAQNCQARSAPLMPRLRAARSRRAQPGKPSTFFATMLR